MNAIVDNPIVVGAAVTFIVWLLKVFNLTPDGWQSIVITMAVSVILGLAGEALAGGLGGITPDTALTVIGRVFTASQLIYQTIRGALRIRDALRARAA